MTFKISYHTIGLHWKYILWNYPSPTQKKPELGVGSETLEYAKNPLLNNYLINMHLSTFANSWLIVTVGEG